MIWIYGHTSKPEPVNDRWLEANGLKYLFGSHQLWTREQAASLAVAALSYAELL
jgi:hypothetical protein